MNSVFACPTCMAPTNDATTTAVFWAIWSMLFVLVPVLGGFITFMVYLVRRQRRFATGQDPELPIPTDQSPSTHA